MSKQPKRKPHVRLYPELLNSAAHVALTIPAKWLHVELLKLYNGRNNGRIVLGMREAADKLRCTSNTAGLRFNELRAKGFIKLARIGWYSTEGCHASEWIVTCADHDGKPATHDYLTWQEGQDFYIPEPKPRARRKPKLRVVTP